MIALHPYRACAEKADFVVPRQRDFETAVALPLTGESYSQAALPLALPLAIQKQHLSKNLT